MGSCRLLTLGVAEKLRASEGIINVRELTQQTEFKRVLRVKIIYTIT
jgi:hypothetical protein